MPTLDLNADLGETVDGVPTADDAAMFALVSSANVACGGHAGDAASMADAVRLAAVHGVAIGAHPSYPDKAGFGRVAMAIAPDELRRSVTEQLAALAAVGAEIRYVKPHGALYHAAGSDPAVAGIVAEAVAAAGMLPVLGSGPAIEIACAEAGVRFVQEAFLDRGYRPDGTLVPRDQPGALLHDAGEVASRAVRLAFAGEVVAVDGTIVRVDAGSLCLHGDTPAAVAMGDAVRAALTHAGVSVKSPW